MKDHHLNKELHNKIMDTIQREAPHTRLYGNLLSAAKTLLIFGLFFGSAFSMSLFLYDIGERMSIYEFTNSAILENSLNFLFEFLIISILGITGFYFLYRQTDWPLVKERFGLVVGSFIIITLVSVGLVVLSKSDTAPWGDIIGNSAHTIEHTLPLRAQIEDKEESAMEENSFFTGIVISIHAKDGSFELEIQNSARRKEKFILSSTTPRITTGDRVIVQYEGEKEHGTLIIDKIKKI